MVTRCAGKYLRSPYPQATRIKTLNFLRYLSLGGGDVLAYPPGFSFFAGDYFLLRGTCTPIPTSHTEFGLHNRA